MTDVVLVTADSIRYDHREELSSIAPFVDKLGITGGHYTRPSLASLLSASYEAALKARVVRPTLPDALASAGYTSIGRAPSPQLDPAFGFDSGFDDYLNYADAGTRGSRRREIFGRIGILRRIYHRLFPPHAKMSNLPTDAAVVENAVEAFNSAESPRFLWVHLMGSHRPYGRGDDAIPRSIDRRAIFAADRLTDAQLAELEEKYLAALSRVDERIATLRSELDTTDSLFVFTADHGDEFGERGQYFHQPQRRRVAPGLVKVPVGFDGVDVPGEHLSLLDVPPTILDALDREVPKSWDGQSLFKGEPDNTLTFAPWNDRATVLWQDFESKLVASDADVMLERGEDRTLARETEVPAELESQLRDLGYVE